MKPHRTLSPVPVRRARARGVRVRRAGPVRDDRLLQPHRVERLRRQIFVGLAELRRRRAGHGVPDILHQRRRLHPGDARPSRCWSGCCSPGSCSSVRRGRIWFRVAIFTPVMLPMVVVAILWSFVYNPDFGLLNAALIAVRAGGLDARLARRRADRAARDLRRLGLGVRRLLHDDLLRRAPPGARPRSSRPRASTAPASGHIFWRVRVPIIRNAIEVAVLLCVTGGFQSFDLFYVHDQRRAVPRHRDPDDLPRAGRVPHRRGRLRLGDGRHPDRRRGRASGCSSTALRRTADREGRAHRRLLAKAKEAAR